MAGSAVPVEPTHDLVRLDVSEIGDAVQLRVISNGSRSAALEFSLEVSGASRSRHRSKTSISKGDEQVLATVRVSKTQDWCAKLELSEDGQPPVVIEEGACG